MAEIETYKVIARVISKKCTCAAIHKVGDEFSIGDTTLPNMCSWAFYALFPFAPVLQFCGYFPLGRQSR